MWPIKRNPLQRAGILGIGVLLVSAAALAQVKEEPAGEQPVAKSTCLICHANLGGRLTAPTQPFPHDVHAEKGLTCASCHGGDPTSMDVRVAMSPAKGFRGKPSRSEIPSFCGRCHSDAAYMHEFNPRVRTDQVAQYSTSQHGRLLQRGDQRVATCINCHSVHDIKLVSDPTSPVYPLNIPATCGKCHSDKEYLAGYDLPSHSQVADYQKSVHYQALTEQGDLSAPTCITCHGSHGATPPGVRSVAEVCGTCHTNNQQLFAKSPHQAAFAALGAPGCMQCHGNHAVVRSTEEVLAPGPQSVCLTCHAADDNGAKRAQEMADSIRSLDSQIHQAREILEQADRLGMEVSAATAELTNAHSHLVMARTEIHSLDQSRVSQQVEEGRKIAAQVAEEGKGKLAEVQTRRKGLAVSSVFILVVVVSLYFYIRENERDKTGES